MTKEDSDFSGFHESVRTLRNSILLANFDRQYRSLLVTSAAPGEGKTTTAANLASAHAEQGKATLLIDGDLRRPSVHRNFNIPSVVGLSNVLMGEIGWRQALVRIEGVAGSYVLPAGPPSRRAADLVGRGLSQLLEEAAAEYDLVVLDAPRCWASPNRCKWRRRWTACWWWREPGRPAARRWPMCSPR